ncbi:hypothetical protein YSY22_31990 [Brevibacillus formosus]
MVVVFGGEAIKISEMISYYNEPGIVQMGGSWFFHWSLDMWLRWGEEYFQSRLQCFVLLGVKTGRSEGIRGETQKW